MLLPPRRLASGGVLRLTNTAWNTAHGTAHRYGSLGVCACVLSRTVIRIERLVNVQYQVEEGESRATPLHQHPTLQCSSTLS